MTEDNYENLTFEEAVELLKQGKARLRILKFFEFGRLEYLADRLLDRVEKSRNDDAEDDIVAVVLLQCASLECFLNDVLIHYAREAFGPDSRQIAEGFVVGSVRSKIYRVVPILSHGKKILDLKSPYIVKLFDLIKVRNKIAHTTDYYLDNQEDLEKASQDRHFMSTLTVEQCKQYRIALAEFFQAIWNGPIQDPQWQHPLIKDAEPDSE